MIIILEDFIQYFCPMSHVKRKPGLFLVPFEQIPSVSAPGGSRVLFFLSSISQDPKFEYNITLIYLSL